MGVVLGMMSRAPTSGHCKTRLARRFGDLGAARLYEAMLRDCLAAFARLGASRLVVLAAPEDDGPRALRQIADPAWDVVPQSGASLGDRLANAMRELSAGGDAVLLISSDSPTLPTAPLAAAIADFRGPRRALLGPCEDGGYYVIGLTTPELGVFARITWSTSKVLGETRARCAELGLALTLLPTAYDVDEIEDAARLEREVAEHPERAPHVAEFFAGEGAREG